MIPDTATLDAIVRPDREKALVRCQLSAGHGAQHRSFGCTFADADVVGHFQEKT